MKKAYVVFALILVFATVLDALSQINSGTWLMDGTTTFSYTDGSTSSTNSTNSVSIQHVNFALRTGPFVAENFALGATIAYSQTDQSVQTGPVQSESATILGCFLRAYAGGLFFIGIGYNRVTLAANSGYSSASFPTNQIPLELGFAGFVSRDLAIEPVLTYIIGEKANTFSVGIGFGLYFGRGGKIDETQ